MSPAEIDPFTARRLQREITEHRSRTGQLPTFQDLEKAGFTRELIKEAMRRKLIEQFYVTLTNGTVVNAFRVPSG